MLLKEVKDYGIDLFITIIDEYNYKYVVEDYQAHENYESFKLIFTFEDCTSIFNDGDEHMHTVAEYVNAKNEVLVKFQDDDFSTLLRHLRTWCITHRTNN